MGAKESRESSSGGEVSIPTTQVTPGYGASYVDVEDNSKNDSRLNSLPILPPPVYYGAVPQEPMSFYSPSYSMNGTSAPIYYTAPPPAAPTRWTRRVSVGSSSCSSLSSRPSTLSATARPAAGVPYVDAPHGVTVRADGTYAWIDTAGVRYDTSPRVRPHIPATTMRYGDAVAAPSVPHSVHNFTESNRAPLRHESNRAPLRYEYRHPSTVSSEKVFDTYQAPHKQLLTPQTYGEDPLSSTFSTTAGYGTLDDTRSDYHTDGLVTNLTPSTNDGSLYRRISEDGTVHTIHQEGDARVLRSVIPPTKYDIISQFPTERTVNSDTIIDYPPPTFALGPTQTVSQFNREIQDLMYQVPMTIHTMRLPPGMSPDDERLKHATVVSERRYQLDRIGFPADEGFTAYVHPQLNTPTSQPHRVVVPDLQAH